MEKQKAIIVIVYPQFWTVL